jgi:hypothetical protein
VGFDRILSKNVEELGRFHWKADGGSDLVGVTFDCIALLVIVHAVWMVLSNKPASKTVFFVVGSGFI